MSLLKLCYSSRVKLVKELYKYNNKYKLCNRDICV